MEKSSIAIDIMGSDLGPEELSKGIIRFIDENKDIDVVIFGDKNILVPIFKDIGKSQVTIVETSSIIPMEIKPLDFLRQKDSSMYQAIDAVKSNRCNAIVSAGSTGGLVSGATILLRLIEGISKAGLIISLPTLKNKPSVLMDVGANNYCDEVDLYSFALMARAYAKYIHKIDKPNISILSNGEEKGKGRDEIVKAYDYFTSHNLESFIGNVEANNVMDGNHDVIVTSGFDGNIFLKSLEGASKLFKTNLKEGFSKNVFTKIGYLLSKSGIKAFKDKLDYKKYGGACLLGVNGLVVKAHGSSNAEAFYNALKVTKNMIKSDLINNIKSEIKNG